MENLPSERGAWLDHSGKILMDEGFLNGESAGRDQADRGETASTQASTKFLLPNG
jgi:hypothetical protein